MCPDLSESILQGTDWITGRVSREADLFPLLKRPGGNPVQVSIANPTSKAGRWRKAKWKNYIPTLVSPVSTPLNGCPRGAEHNDCFFQLNWENQSWERGTVEPQQTVCTSLTGVLMLPALSSPGTVRRDDHLSAVIGVSVIHIQLQAFPLVALDQREQVLWLQIHWRGENGQNEDTHSHRQVEKAGTVFVTLNHC